MNGILRIVPFPKKISTIDEYAELSLRINELQKIVDAYYFDVVGGDFVPTSESCKYFRDHISRIEEVWMENRDTFANERRVKTDIESEKSVDSVILLETLKCLCVVNLLISNDEFMERVAAMSTEDLPSVDRQRLVMADGPILQYSASQLRDALWQVVARWKNIVLDDDVLRYVEMLELRYALFLRFAHDGREHDVNEYRQPVDELHGEMYTCTPVMMLEMTAQFGGICDMLWTRQAFDVQRVFCGADPRPELAVVARLGETLREFAETTRSLSTMQNTYNDRCISCSLRPGEIDVFAPENPLYPVSPHNVLLMCRGRKQHAAIQDIALRKMRDVLRIVCNKLSAADSPEGARLTWDEEVAVICAADMLFKNRFRLAWETMYVVYQVEYRRQRSKFSGCIPLVFNNCNRFNVWHRGQLYETDNAVASIALWLDIVQTECGGKLDGVNISSLCRTLDLSTPGLSFKSVFDDRVYATRLSESTNERTGRNTATRTVIELRKRV